MTTSTEDLILEVRRREEIQKALEFVNLVRFWRTSCTVVIKS